MTKKPKYSQYDKAQIQIIRQNVYRTSASALASFYESSNYKGMTLEKFKKEVVEFGEELEARIMRNMMEEDLKDALPKEPEGIIVVKHVTPVLENMKNPSPMDALADKTLKTAKKKQAMKKAKLTEEVPIKVEPVATQTDVPPVKEMVKPKEKPVDKKKLFQDGLAKIGDLNPEGRRLTEEMMKLQVLFQDSGITEQMITKLATTNNIEHTGIMGFCLHVSNQKIKDIFIK